MKELREIWQQDTNGGDLLDQILKSKAYQKGNIEQPLAKLKRNLIIHMGYAIIITLFYAFIIYYFPIWQVQACIILLIAFNLWALIQSWKLYESIHPDLAEGNVLTELKKHYRVFKTWEKQSLRAALFVYPFAAAGGFMLGGSIGSEKAVDIWMSDFRVVIALFVTIIILVPLSYLLARWMTRYAFGKYVDQLKTRIDELEGEE